MNLREVKDRLKAKKFMRPVVWLWRFIKTTEINIYAEIYIKKFFAEKSSNELALIVNNFKIGDSLYLLANLEGLHITYSGKTITLIVPKSRAELFASFDYVDELVILPDKEFTKLAKYATVDKVMPYELGRGIIHGHTAGYYHALRKCSLNTKIDCIKMWRKVLCINEHAPVTYHRLNRTAVHSIENFAAIKHKVAIINPYSGSMNSTASIYEALGDILQAKGYIVFTNVVGEQKAINGTIPLRCSIYELYSIACEIPLVVSVRSGILDLLIPSGVNMFVIYDRKKIFKTLVSLEDWESSCRIQEVIVETDEDVNDVPEKFSRFLDELAQEGKLS